VKNCVQLTKKIIILLGLLIVSIVAFIFLFGPTPAALGAPIPPSVKAVVNHRLPNFLVVVTNTNDSGVGSLREAISIAPNGSVINFAVTGTITLSTKLPAISQNPLTLEGPPAGIMISGNNSVQVMTIETGSNLTINRLTIANGWISGSGGAIDNKGEITVLNSTFTNNSATIAGGAINSILSGTVAITNSTFYSNSATFGGGIYSNSFVTISNSTFSDNRASITGGAIHSAGTMVLYNTIVANSVSGGNCAGFVTDGGNNLKWNPNSGCASIPGADPRLAPFGNYGGATQTMALLPGSAAIDGMIYNTPNGCPSTDQRGAFRPLGTRCDIGAYESGYIFFPLIFR